MTLRRPINQEEEIKTIKSRNYNLNLSDADVERLAEKALSYGLTAAELLENFIGDIVNGTYSNGSDERMYASEWAERCWFALDSPEKNLLQFLFGEDQYLSCYSYDDLFNIMERIDSAKEDVCLSEKEIANPTEDWKDLVRWDHKKQEYVQSYANVEAYIENEKDLEICISYIFDVIDKYYERILELSYSEKIKDIENIFARDFDKYYNGNIFGNENIVSEYKEILFDDYYNIDNERYFKKEYKYFIEGKFDKAREIYLKNKNNLANYEMKVWEHIENTEKMELPVKNIESVSKYVFYKKKIFDIVNLLKIFCGIFGVGLSSCLCFAIYTVIYYFLMLVIKGQCTNVNRYVIAVLSIIPGIMMTFKLRKEWYDMFAIPNDLESNEKISKLEKKLILVYTILSFIIMIVNIKLI